ncbi:MAG: hypothetical protein ACO2YY_07730 [Pseudohongiellaceae bacterium]
MPKFLRMNSRATNMSYLRAKEVSCYGVGRGTNAEGVSLSFGAHSDQKRILEQELYRFV